MKYYKTIFTHILHVVDDLYTVNKKCSKDHKYLLDTGASGGHSSMGARDGHDTDTVS